MHRSGSRHFCVIIADIEHSIRWSALSAHFESHISIIVYQISYNVITKIEFSGDDGQQYIPTEDAVAAFLVADSFLIHEQNENPISHELDNQLAFAAVFIACNRNSSTIVVSSVAPEYNFIWVLCFGTASTACGNNRSGSLAWNQFDVQWLIFISVACRKTIKYFFGVSHNRNLIYSIQIGLLCKHDMATNIRTMSIILYYFTNPCLN